LHCIITYIQIITVRIKNYLIKLKAYIIKESRNIIWSGYSWYHIHYKIIWNHYTYRYTLSYERA
jgi:hypothetical protein